MMTYKVIIETKAIEDLYGILGYVSNVLLAPDTGRRLYIALYEQILSLENFPAIYPIVRPEPYKTLGVRLMPVKNYNVFYIINEQTSTVHILRILYQRRNWQDIL